MLLKIESCSRYVPNSNFDVNPELTNISIRLDFDKCATDRRDLVFSYVTAQGKGRFFIPQACVYEGEWARRKVDERDE